MVSSDFNDPEALRLQITVALNVVPLISQQIASSDDRQSIVADIVACWLALPADIRDQYSNAEERPHRRGLTRFSWEYVDAVEQAPPFEPEFDQDTSGPWPSDLAEESLVFQRWIEHLDQVKARHAAGDPPDRQWLAGFPRDGNDDTADHTSGILAA